MLYLNFQLKKSKPALIAAAVILTIFIIACVISYSATQKLSDTATRDEAGEYSLVVKDDAQAESFLKSFGVDSVLEKTGEEKIIIPKKFNSLYEKYNEMQKRIGLDLSRYKGKSALKATYKIKSDKADYAVLLLRGNRVIGGHLTSLEYGKGNLPVA